MAEENSESNPCPRHLTGMIFNTMTTDEHLQEAQTAIDQAEQEPSRGMCDAISALQHLLAAVKELDRRQGVTRFPVGE